MSTTAGRPATSRPLAYRKEDKLYFNSISALAHKFYGDPLLPQVNEDLDKCIGRLANALGWYLKDSPEHYRFSTQEQESIISVSRTLNRKLHCIYSWGQSRGERFDIYTHKTKESARTSDLGLVLALPDSTYQKVAVANGVSMMRVRESSGIVQKYLDVTLLSYHREQHHLGWWTRTTFAKDPVVWQMLTEIYTEGEEVKRKARVIAGVKT